MNGNNLVLDSNVLIYLSKGELDFAKITRSYSNVYISVISYMETLGFPFKDKSERQLIEQLLTSIVIIQTDMEISEKVVDYRSRSKIKLPDAIILATAKKMKADLKTANIDDFKNVDKSVKLINPFD